MPQHSQATITFGCLQLQTAAI